MASLRFSQTLTLPRGIKAFINLEVDLTRGRVPVSEPRSTVRSRHVAEQDRSKGVDATRTAALAQGRKEPEGKPRLPDDAPAGSWDSGKNMASWEAGKAPEVTFWRAWLATKGLDYPWDYEPRLDPAQPLQERITQHLGAPPGATVSILDVGAGPLTRLGKRWEGRIVWITAVDALAEQYERLLRDAGITPPVLTQPGEVERLTERFPKNSFDLVNIENALDHSYDPLLGIRQMLEVVRPGGYVLLLHDVNEAHRTGYVGFHQWNFCADNGHFIIWNPQNRVSVNDALGDIAEITVDDNIDERGYEKAIFVTLKKK
jgi:SAM-dependent methyltransferase